jgi:hypothetical protein
MLSVKVLMQFKANANAYLSRPADVGQVQRQSRQSRSRRDDTLYLCGGTYGKEHQQIR